MRRRFLTKQRRTRARGLWVVALVLVLPLFGLAAACEEQAEEEPAQQQELFADLTVPDDFTVRPERILVRWRPVAINFAVLSAVSAEPVVFNLFEDVRVNVMPAGTSAAPSGQGWVWTGQVEGETNGRVNLIVNGGVLTGEIHVGTALYRVRYLPPGVHIVQEINPQAFGPD